MEELVSVRNECRQINYENRIKTTNVWLKHTHHTNTTEKGRGEGGGELRGRERYKIYVVADISRYNFAFCMFYVIPAKQPSSKFRCYFGTFSSFSILTRHLTKEKELLKTFILLQKVFFFQRIVVVIVVIFVGNTEPKTFNYRVATATKPYTHTFNSALRKYLSFKEYETIRIC